jgi:hypothetical protein
VANIAKALCDLILAVLWPYADEDLWGLIVVCGIIGDEVVDLLYREVLQRGRELTSHVSTSMRAKNVT